MQTGLLDAILAYSLRPEDGQLFQQMPPLNERVDSGLLSLIKQVQNIPTGSTKNQFEVPMSSAAQRPNLITTEPWSGSTFPPRQTDQT